MTALLDANALIAPAVEDHVHREAAEKWMSKHLGEGFATTPITQGTLVRLLLRDAVGVADAYLAALAGTHGGRLVKLDRAMAATFPAVCELIPS